MSLAIECGATKSSALFVHSNSKDNFKKLKLDPANFTLLSQAELENFLEVVKKSLNDEPVYELGIGMPGIITDKDKLTVANTLQKVWPDLKTWWVGNDVETALACLDNGSTIQIVVISGTGSNCFGTDGQSKLKIGGFGHVLGDRGSGYAISLLAMRMALREYEQSLCLNAQIPTDLNDIPQNLLISSIMTYLKVQTIPELVTWSTNASKMEIASLAPQILELWKSGNPIAKAVVESCIKELAEDCCTLINKFSNNLSNAAQGEILKIEIGLTGSIFTQNSEISKFFERFVEDNTRPSTESIRSYTLLHETVQGAFKMLKMNFMEEKSATYDQNGNILPSSNEELAKLILPEYLGLPQTECRNERSMNLHQMPISEAIDLMISEERGIYAQIEKQRGNLEKLVEKVSRSLQNGGRLFYVGAGTSGRLGILDASECPPTFRTAPEMVQGIIAGGFSSVSKAKEGAEDSIIDGMAAVADRLVNKNDVVVGIAASGRTPFVWGAMYKARELGAFTAFLTFNVRLDMKMEPDLILAMDLGPEVLTGSTRLKAGSATKCILNILSTLAMVKMGKCFENLMVDLNPANEKLKQRALRIVLLLTSNLNHVTEPLALEILQRNKYDIKSTVVALREL